VYAIFCYSHCFYVIDPHAINFCLLYSSVTVTDVTALSGIATDVEVSIHEIQTLLDEEDKQEKEFQVKIC